MAPPLLPFLEQALVSAQCSNTFFPMEAGAPCPWRHLPAATPMACCSSRSPSSLCPLPQEQQLLLPWSASLLPLGSFLQAELLCQERLLHLTAAPFFPLALLSRLLAAMARRLSSFSLPHKTASAQELLLHGRRPGWSLASALPRGRGSAQSCEQEHAMARSAPSMDAPCCSLRPALSIQRAPFSSMENQQRAPFLAVRRGARRLFGKMRSKPRAAAALPFDLHSPRRVSLLSCSLCSPIRNAVENRGEKHPAALAIIIFLCSEKC
eukprot:XP_023156860.1 uncharacterized protein LOC111590167 [Zea mays]